MPPEGQRAPLLTIDGLHVAYGGIKALSGISLEVRHGEIVAIDVSEALKVPGVRAIVTGADCDKPFGVLPIARSEYPLARDRVRYRGEPVAAVAAIDDASAREALRRIKIKVRMYRIDLSTAFQ